MHHLPPSISAYNSITVVHCLYKLQDHIIMNPQQSKLQLQLRPRPLTSQGFLIMCMTFRCHETGVAAATISLKLMDHEIAQTFHSRVQSS